MGKTYTEWAKEIVGDVGTHGAEKLIQALETEMGVSGGKAEASAELTEQEIKTVRDMLAEVQTHRSGEEEKRDMTDDGNLYEDERRLAEKLNIKLEE